MASFVKQKFKPQNLEYLVENAIDKPTLGYVVNSPHLRHRYRFKDEIYEPLLESLENALSKPLFCCGGSLQISDMGNFVLKVIGAEDDEGTKENWKEFALANLPVDELLKYCIPAPFGDLQKMKTVLDAEVRLAYEIESARFSIEKERMGFDYRWIKDFPGSKQMKTHIDDNLTPGRSTQLCRYKLNVYGEGGFFKPHVDSPASDEMIGTLVLCLPSPHKGGELIVNHDGLQHVFDFSQESEDANTVQWAAFYSDCIHEVKPVLEGHRVTITYNISLPAGRFLSLGYYYSGTKEDVSPLVERFEASADSPSLFSKAVDRVNIELEKMIHRQDESSPSQIGFFLKHKYTSNGLQPQLLKGEDKLLFDFLNKKQWLCTLKSVLSRYQTNQVSPEDFDDESHLDEAHEIYEFNPLKSTVTTPVHDSWHHGRPSSPTYYRQYGSLYRNWRLGIPFIEIYRKVEGELVRNHEGHGNWLGNEIEDVGVDKIYLESAVIVDLCKKH